MVICILLIQWFFDIKGFTLYNDDCDFSPFGVISYGIWMNKQSPTHHEKL